LKTPDLGTSSSRLNNPDNSMNSLFDSADPVTGCAPSLHLKRLRRELLAAQLALGERMYLAGIDDGRLGTFLAALDQRVRRAEAARLPLGPLLAQRRDLLLRLAAAALEDDAPLPGAQAEYEAARQALTALREEEGKVVKNRPEPLPVGS
jgi:small-conductance mechanosensitive channel